jgi:predicted DNA-binding protein (UPF0251 family)
VKIAFIMPRSKRVLRKVLSPPIIKGFKPFGPDADSLAKEPINLFFEEYEALRLSDYDGLNHLNASKMMDVSRPTFTRIYASALQKIAQAFVDGRKISIEGGKVYFDSDFYQCLHCHCFFNNPYKETAITQCPLCGDLKIQKTDFDLDTLENKDDFCICPICAFKSPCQKDLACGGQKCPQCGSTMKKVRE